MNSLEKVGAILIPESIKHTAKYHLSKNQVNSRMDEEDDLEDILDTVLEIQPGLPPFRIMAMQIREELQKLTKIADQRQPETVLEIGTANGGTFYTWCRYLDSSTNIISLDLPGGQFGGGFSRHEEKLYQQFAPEKNLDFVRDNSHDESTYDKVEEIIKKNGEVDFLFIDGDHTYNGVKQDFEMYQRLVSDDGIIALHDIVHHPDEQESVERRRQKVDIDQKYLTWSEDYRNCNVDMFWEELKEEYQTEEIIAHHQQTWGGIGVVYL